MSGHDDDRRIPSQPSKVAKGRKTIQSRQAHIKDYCVGQLLLGKRERFFG
jgi:hypothetical protein